MAEAAAGPRASVEATERPEPATEAVATRQCPSAATAVAETTTCTAAAETTHCPTAATEQVAAATLAAETRQQWRST